MSSEVRCSVVRWGRVDGKVEVHWQLTFSDAEALPGDYDVGGKGAAGPLLSWFVSTVCHLIIWEKKGDGSSSLSGSLRSGRAL